MRCRSTSYAFDSACPLWRYGGELRSLVLEYKAGRRSLAGFFSEAVARAVRQRYPGRVIVPVPPRPGKMRRKGWDQVEDIARMLEKHHGLEVARILVRADGMQQKALGLEARTANMLGKVRVEEGASVPVDPILLDDVLTTGATLSACAAALKLEGASRVDAITIAAD
jgi:predicted amidophosphoribosyltransferase